MTGLARTRRPSRIRWRPLLGLALVLVGLAAFYLSSNHLAPILSYRLDDQRTLVITIGVEHATWTRLVRVVETDAEVQVLAESLEWPGPRTIELTLVDFTVVLSQALGNRVVLDGAGMVVPRVEAAGDVTLAVAD